MKLEWSAAALADLDRFAAFLHDRHPRLAVIIGAEIRRKAQLLSEHPLVGRAIKGRPEYRELVLDVANARYVFRYVFDGRRLVMLRVFIAVSSGSERRLDGHHAASLENAAKCKGRQFPRTAAE